MAGESIGNAYLNVIPKIDGDAKSLGNSFGSKFSGGAKASISAGAVALGNILSTGLMSAASALGSQFSDAFVGYMNFEQLSGGVEKIFDEADISVIMKDAQEAYKTLNLSANEYLESINRTGAAFAQTMGDQKGYDTAKQGMQAIADYASGTGRSVSELNEKYALITRATSSYQSIADQFSGLLPATSADFLEQAQAAGLLSESYTKLTDVPVAEYQQAVSAMLEMGVKDMGLYQNTMSESTGTISGSINMLKSAWSNFLTELGKDDADLEATTKNLVDSLVAVAENVGPRLLEMAGNAFEAFPQIIEKLQPYIDDFAAKASAFIQEHQPEIQAASQKLFDGVKAGIGMAAQAAVQALVDFLVTIVTTFPEWFPAMIQSGVELILSLVEGLAKGLEPFVQEINDVLQEGMDAVTEAVSGFVAGGLEIATGIATGIGDGIGQVQAKAGEIVSSIGSTLSGARDTVVQIANDIRNRFSSGLSSLVGKVKSIFDNVKKAITEPIEAARSLIQSAIEKISSIIGGVKLELPRIALPHFHVSGGSFPWGIGGQGSPPSFSVDWYARGGFVNGAQLIGAGEQGTELIWPEYSPYFDKYANAIAEHIGGGNITINLNYDASADANDMLMDITSGIRQLRAAGAI